MSWIQQWQLLPFFTKTNRSIAQNMSSGIYTRLCLSLLWLCTPAGRCTNISCVIPQVKKFTAHPQYGLVIILITVLHQIQDWYSTITVHLISAYWMMLTLFYQLYYWGRWTVCHWSYSVELAKKDLVLHLVPQSIPPAQTTGSCY